MKIQPESSIRRRVNAAIAWHTRRLNELVPTAQIEHIGATAVPGSLTKGDVDLLLRVPPERFQDALATLKSHYAPNSPDDWTPTLASFKEQPEKDIPVGIQLVVANGINDQLFMRWRDLLRSDPQILARYNEFKSAHADDDYETYTAAKGRFIEELLGNGLGSE